MLKLFPFPIPIKLSSKSIQARNLRTMKTHQMGAQPLCFCFFFFLIFSTLAGSVYGDDLKDKCAKDVTKLTPCLNFAKGQAATPTKECCDAASEIREGEPECLCYIIQQTHNGNPMTKSFGIQEAKLLQLPNACNLKSANISDCPRLLKLPAGSPDAAIFTNANLSSPVTPSSSSSTGTSSQNASYGSRLRSHFIDILPVAFVIVFVAIPTGFTFCV